jgi:4-hydroxy-L-threonine phosphate dehydrogenase PdxA
VTAPVSKMAWHAAGHVYPGQTEYLAERAGAAPGTYGMVGGGGGLEWGREGRGGGVQCRAEAAAAGRRVGASLRSQAAPPQRRAPCALPHAQMFVARSPSSGWQCNLMLATAHVPLADVPRLVTPALLDQKLRLLLATLPRDFGYSKEQVGALGVGSFFGGAWVGRVPAGGTQGGLRRAPIGALHLGRRAPAERPPPTPQPIPPPPPPQIHVAVAGLNPHSGECGQIGREEEDVIGPWLEAQRAAHPAAWLEGPVPPDTLWVRPGRAFRGGRAEAEAVQAADAYLAMYHDQVGAFGGGGGGGGEGGRWVGGDAGRAWGQGGDSAARRSPPARPCRPRRPSPPRPQGLIPLKMMAFDLAVNFTAGLPFVRTSPDHGTAFDLDGGLADPTSLKEAIRVAARVVQQRAASAAAAARV